MKDEVVFEGSERNTGKQKWIGARADRIFGSNSELRALAELAFGDRSKHLKELE